MIKAIASLVASVCSRKRERVTDDGDEEAVHNQQPQRGEATRTNHPSNTTTDTCTWTTPLPPADQLPSIDTEPTIEVTLIRSYMELTSMFLVDEGTAERRSYPYDTLVQHFSVLKALCQDQDPRRAELRDEPTKTEYNKLFRSCAVDIANRPVMWDGELFVFILFHTPHIGGSLAAECDCKSSDNEMKSSSECSKLDVAFTLFLSRVLCNNLATRRANNSCWGKVLSKLYTEGELAVTEESVCYRWTSELLRYADVRLILLRFRSVAGQQETDAAAFFLNHRECLRWSHDRKSLLDYAVRCRAKRTFRRLCEQEGIEPNLRQLIPSHVSLQAAVSGGELQLLQGLLDENKDRSVFDAPTGMTTTLQIRRYESPGEVLLNLALQHEVPDMWVPLFSALEKCGWAERHHFSFYTVKGIFREGRVASVDVLLSLVHNPLLWRHHAEIIELALERSTRGPGVWRLVLRDSFLQLLRPFHVYKILEHCFQYGSVSDAKNLLFGQYGVKLSKLNALNSLACAATRSDGDVKMLTFLLLINDGYLVRNLDSSVGPIALVGKALASSTCIPAALKLLLEEFSGGSLNASQVWRWVEMKSLSWECLQVLLDDPRFQFILTPLPNGNGNTLLHEAALAGNHELVKAMVAANSTGSLATVRNSNGETAQDLIEREITDSLS